MVGEERSGQCFHSLNGSERLLSSAFGLSFLYGTTFQKQGDRRRWDLQRVDLPSGHALAAGKWPCWLATTRALSRYLSEPACPRMDRGNPLGMSDRYIAI